MNYIKSLIMILYLKSNICNADYDAGLFVGKIWNHALYHELSFEVKNSFQGLSSIHIGKYFDKDLRLDFSVLIFSDTVTIQNKNISKYQDSLSQEERLLEKEFEVLDNNHKEIDLEFSKRLDIAVGSTIFFTISDTVKPFLYGKLGVSNLDFKDNVGIRESRVYDIFFDIGAGVSFLIYPNSYAECILNIIRLESNNQKILKPSSNLSFLSGFRVIF